MAAIVLCQRTGREDARPDQPHALAAFVHAGIIQSSLNIRHATLKFKAQLYAAIMREAQKYTPKQLERILGEYQPRISELLNGKIANKSVDKLLSHAGRLGIEPKASFPQTNKQIVERELEAVAG